jgi:hypothetical protein
LRCAEIRFPRFSASPHLVFRIGKDHSSAPSGRVFRGRQSEILEMHVSVPEGHGGSSSLQAAECSSWRKPAGEATEKLSRGIFCNTGTASAGPQTAQMETGRHRLWRNSRTRLCNKGTASAGPQKAAERGWGFSPCAKLPHNHVPHPFRTPCGIGRNARTTVCEAHPGGMQRK